MAITTSVSPDAIDEAGLVEQRLDEFVTASAKIAPGADRDSQVWGMQFDAGLAWVDFPNGLGGLGVSAALRASVTNRLRAEGIRDSGSANGIGVLLAGPTLVAFGNTEQRRRYLRPLFTGQEIWCQLFSEPGAGSDLASLATRAVARSDEWVVNGQKVWTTLGHVSRWGLLCARTAPELPKHRGLTFFVLDMQAPGVEVRPIRQLTGDAEFNEVFLNDVVIPSEAIIGRVNDGWKVILGTLANERAAYGNGPLGIGNGAISEASRLWEVHGRSHPELRDRYVQLWTQARAARLATARLHYPSYAMRQPERMHRVGTSDVRRAWLYARCGTIAGGTSEIQRTIVADRVLQLPREPQLDRDVPWQQGRRG
jgi:alkylation response protein AidB-like acyl-CoA dehydrogenase